MTAAPAKHNAKSPDEQATLHAQAAHLENLLPRLLRRMFTLEPHHPVAEMPMAQLRVCALLQEAPRTLSGISEEMAISLSATTQIADRLERAGLVERVAEVEDRRRKTLQLTAHGREIMASRSASRVARATETLAALSPAQRIEVLNALDRLLAAGIATAPAAPQENDPLTALVER